MSWIIPGFAACGFCGLDERRHQAKGYCDRCYYRAQTLGTLCDIKPTYCPPCQYDEDRDKDCMECRSLQCERAGLVRLMRSMDNPEVRRRSEYMVGLIEDHYGRTFKDLVHLSRGGHRSHIVQIARFSTAILLLSMEVGLDHAGIGALSGLSERAIHHALRVGQKVLTKDVRYQEDYRKLRTIFEYYERQHRKALMGQRIGRMAQRRAQQRSDWRNYVERRSQQRHQEDHGLAIPIRRQADESDRAVRSA